MIVLTNGVSFTPPNPPSPALCCSRSVTSTVTSACPIVDDSQPSLAAQGLAQLANGGEPPLQCVAGRRTAWHFGGNDVDADRFLPVRLGLTATGC